MSTSLRAAGPPLRPATSDVPAGLAGWRAWLRDAWGLTRLRAPAPAVQASAARTAVSPAPAYPLPPRAAPIARFAPPRAPVDTWRLALRAGPDGAQAAALPAAATGTWCRFSLRLPPPLAAACVQLHIEAGNDPAAILPLPGRRRMRRAIVFVPAAATGVRLHLFGGTVAAPNLALRCARLSRPAAALALGAGRLPHLAAILLRGLFTAPRALPGRLRAELGAGAIEGVPPDPAADYALWIRLFEDGAPILPAGLSITVLVLHAAEAGAALAASLAAAATALAAFPTPAGATPAGPIAVGPVGVSLDRALAATRTDYVALLQAGEILPPHALARLAAEAAAHDRPALLYADEDRLTADGTRCDPQFKPAPSRSLMLSGVLATGVWLIRRDLLAAPAPAAPGASPGGPATAAPRLPPDIAHSAPAAAARPPGAPNAHAAQAWAEAVRLDAWLRLHEAGGAGATCHVPLVLTHRRADTEIAPPAVLAAAAQAHCARTGLPARIVPARPLQLRLAAPRAARPLVSLIVPSTCRTAYAASCLDAVLARTDYAELELVLVLARPGPPDAAQRRRLDRLAADPRVRPVLVDTPAFNFAAACNHGVAAARGDLLCLLNDDVTPRDPGWLAAMVGHLADPAVGVVGARLLYPDGTVQHAGILLRPDGTGSHWHRSLPATAAGYGGRARLAQEYAAVTGACLLTRRPLWDQLGGLDEAFATAFNDVDFCLRARAAGTGVVLAAEAELTHAELRSFGRHYGPGEAARNRADRARLLARFPTAFAADPFHSPNLSPWYGDGRALRFPPGEPT